MKKRSMKFLIISLILFAGCQITPKQQYIDPDFKVNWYYRQEGTQKYLCLMPDDVLKLKSHLIECDDLNFDGVQ